MQPHTLVAAAAAPTMKTFRAITPGQLGAPTPCSEYDVRGLINHLLFWGPSLAGAARKESVLPPAASEQDVRLAGSDWRARLETQMESTATAWSAPDAWEGTTRMGGPMDMPGAVVGGMVVSELIVHGWDLAKATGQNPSWSDGVLEFTYEMVAKSAEQGRDMGVYGPEVPVPGTAPLLARILGLTGRDPGWTP